jgi:Mrp family chromosome partitioning ATPase
MTASRGVERGVDRSVDRDDTAAARRVLLEQVQHRRVVVCVGSGGVGKTTTAAALGLAAAALGRKTLVITIDPARRLANALGLEALSHVPQLVDSALVAHAARQLSSSSSPCSSQYFCMTWLVAKQTHPLKAACGCRWCSSWCRGCWA